MGLKAARGESSKKGDEETSVEDELEAELKALKQPKDKKAEAFNSYDTGCKVSLASCFSAGNNLLSILQCVYFIDTSDIDPFVLIDAIYTSILAKEQITSKFAFFANRNSKSHSNKQPDLSSA